MRSLKLWGLLIHVQSEGLDLSQGHRYVRDINCRWCFLDSCTVQLKCFTVAAYNKEIMHNKLCVTDGYGRETINAFFSPAFALEC